MVVRQLKSLRTPGLEELRKTTKHVRIADVGKVSYGFSSQMFDTPYKPQISSSSDGHTDKQASLSPMTTIQMNYLNRPLVVYYDVDESVRVTGE
jgi:hypothetical protein